MQGWNKRVRRGVWAASNWHNRSVVSHPKTYIAVSLLTLLICAIGVPLRLLAEGGMMGDTDPLPAFLPNLTQPGWELADKMYCKRLLLCERARVSLLFHVPAAVCAALAPLCCCCLRRCRDELLHELPGAPPLYLCCLHHRRTMMHNAARLLNFI